MRGPFARKCRKNDPKLHAESPTCWQRCFRFPIQKTLKVHYFKFVLLVTMDRVTEPCGDIARYMPLARVTNRVTIWGPNFFAETPIF